VNGRLTAPLSLAAAGLAVLVMALWGLNALTAPFSGDDEVAANGECGTGTAHTVKRSDITVSVFNAGERKGRAGATLDLLEEAGFRPGAIGNAPKGVTARVAVVRTTQQVHPDATLVARALGAHVPVVVTSDDLGAGVDVIIGDKFEKLNPKAPRAVRVSGTSDC